jgi:cobalt-zinc-cadmium efflux system protein
MPHDHSDHDHGHSHGHGHSHTHAAPEAGGGPKFALAAGINLAFVVFEAAYGLIANSSALLADAGHNLSDVLSLLLAWGAAVLARRQPTARRTYGLRRTSIMAAFLNAAALIVVVVLIAIEAFWRLGMPSPVATTEVMLVAGAGIVVNLGTALLFRNHGELNARGAYLHLAADAAVSLGVVLSAVAIYWTGLSWIDPVTSLVIVAIIAVSGWGLLRDSVDMALDAVPPGVDEQAVGDYLRALPGTAQLHHLHIWALSTTETALTAHLVRPGLPLDDGFLVRVADELKQKFGIAHATLQVEQGPCGEGHDCGGVAGL